MKHCSKQIFYCGTYRKFDGAAAVHYYSRYIVITSIVISGHDSTTFGYFQFRRTWELLTVSYHFEVILEVLLNFLVMNVCVYGPIK